jgi:glycosyltransferase involved in cell wall biosynthesis
MINSGKEGGGLKLLLLISHKVAEGRHGAVANDERPQADYDALAEAVRAIPGGQADILDWGSVERETGWFIRLIRRLYGYNVALALLGYQRCREYDAVFCHGESVALPFAFLISLRSRRPRHVALAYYFVGRRYALWYRVLGADRGMDTIFTLSREQYARGRRLNIAEDKLILLDSCGYVDQKFFSVVTGITADERQICSTGLEFRDYETLISAVAELPDVKLKIDPNSPWSLHRSDVGGEKIPPNVEIVRMKLGASRQLYSESAAIVIPLHVNSIGAGSTTMVEAMLMGKPVIITRSQDKTFAGRKDLVDGENLIMVDVGDVPGLRDAIGRLMTDRELRRHIGVRARKWAEQHASREQWLEIMIGALRGAPVRLEVSVGGKPSLGIGI